ncbi:transcriptional regulator [Sphingobacteriaceae bacterium]|nr:transcriptional regulator [Sphingobacteriaceae bacterium]
MDAKRMFELIKVNEYSSTPKYLQLYNSILDGIASGSIKKGDLLPSINELSFQLEISRDTAEKGYRSLKQKGVLGSVPGKGYFIENTDFTKPTRIFLLFNKLSAHKKIIYDSFAAAMGENVFIDLFIYNSDFGLFKKILANAKQDYSYYVIIPHFIEGGENAHEIINTIPKGKLIILDRSMPGIKGEYGAVYENFSKDIYSALTKAETRLRNYSTIKIIFPENSYYPEEIIEGVKRFCAEFKFECKVIPSVTHETINKGDVFINLMEDDLVVLIERIISQGLHIGTDIGIISYNEVPLKKIILKGITTVSTDFKLMGETAAKLVLEHSTSQVEIPFALILRESL